MKKLIFGLGIAVALISCGGSKEQAPVAVDTTVAVSEDTTKVVADTVVVAAEADSTK